jgi:cytidylate kinase
VAIITISRGTFSGGQNLARCIAGKLGYRVISREVLVKAAQSYGSSLEKLSDAIAEVPGFLEGLSAERAHYLAFIRAVLGREIKNDNVIYHGHAGQLLIPRLPHLVRVRIIANMEYRIQSAMERNKLKREEAVKFIKNVDEKRVKWTKFLYHADWHDPSLYDLVINIDNLTISDACDIVSYTASLERFKTTPEAIKMVDDLVLSTEVRAAVASTKGIADSGIEVEADAGAVTIGGTVSSVQDADKIREIVRGVSGVISINSKMQVKSFW